MDERGRHKKTNTGWFHLCEVLRIVEVIKTENIRVTVRGLGNLIRTEFVLPDEKSYMGMGGGNGSTTCKCV